MTEPTIRMIVLVAVAVFIAGVWWWGRPRRARVRMTVRTDLEPGVVLFSSETCASCRTARKAVQEVFGDAHREIRFEDDPPGFGRLGISKVPTVMIVGTDHETVVLEGVPSRRQLRAYQSGWGSLNE